MATLIDSSVFIEIERRGQSLSALEATLGSEPFGLASITASALLVGVRRAVSERQRARRTAFVDAILDRIPVLPFDLETARSHARLPSELACRSVRTTC